MDVKKSIEEKKVTITNQGMVTIPAAFRKSYGLKDGDKVLIIEDHPSTSEMLSNILEMEGIICISAPDGQTGIELANSRKPDLILLDIMMPEMSGFDVCTKLKTDPKTSHIPIIIVSVRSTEEAIQKGKASGADEYITKPFDPFKLIEAVKKYF